MAGSDRNPAPGQPRRDTSGAPTPAESIARLRGVRVLVVEDDPMVRDILSAVLLRFGGVAILVEGVAEARERMAGQGPFDLAVVDVSLPDGDGVRCAHELRQQQPDLRVLFSSGGEPWHLEQLAAGLPGATTLPKPYTVVELLAAVGRALAPPAGPVAAPGEAGHGR